MMLHRSLKLIDKGAKHFDLGIQLSDLLLEGVGFSKGASAFSWVFGVRSSDLANG